MAKSGLFVKKSISSLLKEASDSKHGLKRTLGALDLTTMGIGAIIGAGIFVLIGTAAAEFAGPAILLSFVFAAIICVLVAFCYAEFASLIPISGSAYSYAYATMGEFAAWILGWGLTAEYLFSSCTVAVGWSSYLNSLLKDFGLEIPTRFASSPIIYDAVEGWKRTGAVFNLPAVFIVAIIGLLIAVGIKTAARFNDILVVVKIGVILLFIACGIAYINTDNLTPFIPENTGVFGQYGWSGIFRGAGLVFFAFIGFDAVSTLAQEAKEPQKSVAKGMFGSLGISTIIFIAVGFVITGLVNYRSLSVADPFAVAVNALGENFVWLRYVTKIAILIGLPSVILVMLNGQTRIFYAMAQDGLLPASFGSIYPKFRTPLFNTVVLTIIAAVLVGIFPVGILGQFTVMGALFVFAIVCFGILMLRYTQPLLNRPFKTPFVPWIPLAGTLACIIQMILMPGVTWIQMMVWMFIGLWVYFAYGQKHSKVRNAKK